MKNISLAIAIPIVALVIVIGIAVILQIAKSTKLPVSTQKLPLMYEQTQTPESGGFGDATSGQDTTGTSDLESDLQTTVDDGGLSEFSGLEKEAAGL